MVKSPVSKASFLCRAIALGRSFSQRPTGLVKSQDALKDKRLLRIIDDFEKVEWNKTTTNTLLEFIKENINYVQKTKV
jgi:hypothetical protein